MSCCQFLRSPKLQVLSCLTAEGRAQSFHGVVKPLGDTRPAWKVLRVLGNLLGLDGLITETSEAVRDAVLGQANRMCLRNLIISPMCDQRSGSSHAWNVSLTSIFTRPMRSFRRSESLQRTADAKAANTVHQRGRVRSSWIERR